MKPGSNSNYLNTNSLKPLLVLSLVLAFCTVADAKCPLRPNQHFGYIQRIGVYAQPKLLPCSPPARARAIVSIVAVRPEGPIWDRIIKRNYPISLTDYTLYWRCNSKGCFQSRFEQIRQMKKYRFGTFGSKYLQWDGKGFNHPADKFWTYEEEKM